MRNRRFGDHLAAKKIEVAQREVDDFEVVLIHTECSQYCFSMIPVLLLFVSMMAVPVFSFAVRFSSGLTFLIASAVVICTAISMTISDRSSLLAYIRHAINFNHFLRTLVHVIWLNFANDFIFGRILTMIILPLSSVRQSHDSRSFFVYVFVHMVLTIHRFHGNLEDGLPWLVGSFICCVMLCDIGLQRDLSRSSHLQAAGAWQKTVKLLSGFCDAVVKLDKNLCIQNPPRQLAWLLCPDGSNDAASFHGTSFLDHLASDNDRQAFAAEQQRYAANEISGIPAALQVGLVFGNTCKRVELFQVISKGEDELDHHLVGIREMPELVSRDEDYNAPVRVNPQANHVARTLKDLPDCAGLRKASSRSSRSTRSSHSRSSQNCNVSELAAIDYVFFDLFGLDFDICDFGIRFNSSNQEGSLSASRFVKSSQRDEFGKWLQLSANSLFHGLGQVSRHGCLLFHTPTRHGNRSQELFLAQSVSIQKLDDDQNENKSACDSFGLEDAGVRVRFENISLVNPLSNTRAPLNVVVEDHGANEAEIDCKHCQNVTIDNADGEDSFPEGFADFAETESKKA